MPPPQQATSRLRHSKSHTIWLHFLFLALCATIFFHGLHVQRCLADILLLHLTSQPWSRAFPQSVTALPCALYADVPPILKQHFLQCISQTAEPEMLSLPWTPLFSSYPWVHLLLPNFREGRLLHLWVSTTQPYTHWATSKHLTKSV